MLVIFVLMSKLVKLDLKYFCVNHICEICVQRIIIHLK